MSALPLDGCVAILRERVRQITGEGYEPESDQGHTGRELAWAAFCYVDRAVSDNPRNPEPPPPWPWGADTWKPSDPERMLVKAGALIAAEIDRIRKARDTDKETAR